MYYDKIRKKQETLEKEEIIMANSAFVEDELDNVEAPDYLDDFGDAELLNDDLDGLSSDLDNWGSEDYDADRNYLYALLR